jgi:hypothetical protein
MVNTLKAIYSFSGKPILIKNAWNCFRIRSLIKIFPNCHFIWIRRDIEKSAISDLIARRIRGSPNKVWSSATTANFKEILKKPYWEQVVEQQYEYNRTISQDLKLYGKGQFHQLWYESICLNTKLELIKINKYFKSKRVKLARKKLKIEKFRESKKYLKFEDDYKKISNYVNHNYSRFRDYRYLS